MELNNNYRGKLMHCDESTECETIIKGYKPEFSMDVLSFRNMFFRDLGLDYIFDYFLENEEHFHIAVHSEKTSTCKEKSKIINFDLENVIKGFYLEDSIKGNIYGLAIPGNKSYDKTKIAELLGIENVNGRIKKTDKMPVNIEYGTVHPFVNEEAFNEIGLKLILFDKFHLEKSSKSGKVLADFSFTTPDFSGYDNHKISIQMNYKGAFEILKNKFGEDRIKAVDLIND